MRVIRKDWDVIRREYITTPITMDELCEKHTLAHSTMAWHMKREQWTDKRKEHCKRVDMNSLKGDIV